MLCISVMHFDHAFICVDHSIFSLQHTLSSSKIVPLILHVIVSVNIQIQIPVSILAFSASVVRRTMSDAHSSSGYALLCALSLRNMRSCLAYINVRRLLFKCFVATYHRVCYFAPLSWMFCIHYHQNWTQLKCPFGETSGIAKDATCTKGNGHASSGTICVNLNPISRWGLPTILRFMKNCNSSIVPFIVLSEKYQIP